MIKKFVNWLNSQPTFFETFVPFEHSCFIETFITKKNVHHCKCFSETSAKFNTKQYYTYVALVHALTVVFYLFKPELLLLLKEGYYQNDVFFSKNNILNFMIKLVSFILFRQQIQVAYKLWIQSIYAYVLVYEFTYTRGILAKYLFDQKAFSISHDISPNL